MWYVLCGWAAVATATTLVFIGRWLTERDRADVAEAKIAGANDACVKAEAWSETQAFNLNLLWETLQAERGKRAPRTPPPIPDGPADVIWHRRTHGFSLPRYELDTDEA